jgi:GGDEF domain-containing protein
VDLQLDLLLDATEELAKRWLLALLGSRPLQRAGEIPLARFSREAPPLCARVLRALTSDIELERLNMLGAAPDRADASELPVWLGELVGAREIGEIVAAAESLRAVLWQGIVGNLADATASKAGQVRHRLAHACASLTVSVGIRGELPADQPPAARPAADRPAAAAPSEGDRAPRIALQDAPPAPDEEIDVEDPWAIDPAPCAERTTAPEGDEEPFAPGAEGAAWPQHDVPFVVLLVEVVGAERLRDAEDPVALEELMAAVERALLEPTGPGDRLAPEGAGRWWLVAPGADAAEGRSLAERLARSVRSAVADRHGPLKVVIGTAASPEDGADAAELAERAEEELYAARASGVCVLPAPAVSPAVPNG